MAKNKTQPTKKSVSNFIQALDDELKIIDSNKLIDIMTSITSCEPKMWGPSIIGFDQYHYKYKSGREGDFLKVGFSPRKREFSIYIMAGFSRYGYLLEKLGTYHTGKSCLYVKRLNDIDTDILKELITESVAYIDTIYP